MVDDSMCLQCTTHHIVYDRQTFVCDVSNLCSSQGDVWKVDSDSTHTKSQTYSHKYILSVRIVSSTVEAPTETFAFISSDCRGEKPKTGQQEAVLSKIDTDNLSYLVFKLFNYISRKSLCWISAPNNASHSHYIKSCHARYHAAQPVDCSKPLPFMKTLNSKMQNKKELVWLF